MPMVCLSARLTKRCPAKLHGVSVGQNLQLKAPVSAGTYRLIAAVYDASMPGLPRLWTSKTQDFLELGEITVSE